MKFGTVLVRKYSYTALFLRQQLKPHDTAESEVKVLTFGLHPSNHHVYVKSDIKD